MSDLDDFTFIMDALESKVCRIESRLPVLINAIDGVKQTLNTQNNKLDELCQLVNLAVSPDEKDLKSYAALQEAYEALQEAYDKYEFIKTLSLGNDNDQSANVGDTK